MSKTANSGHCQLEMCELRDTEENSFELRQFLSEDEDLSTLYETISFEVQEFQPVPLGQLNCCFDWLLFSRGTPTLR